MKVGRTLHGRHIDVTFGRPQGTEEPPEFFMTLERREEVKESWEVWRFEDPLLNAPGSFTNLETCPEQHRGLAQITLSFR